MSRSFKVAAKGSPFVPPSPGLCPPIMRFTGMPLGVPAEAHIVVWIEDELERGPKMAGRVRLGGHVLTV